MDQYRVCLIAPPGYIHAACFKEVAFLVKSAIESCGIPCDIKLNDLAQDRINIIIGYHLMEYDERLVKYRYIVYQFEQLTSQERFYPENSKKVLSHAEEVWDYAPGNIAFLKTEGIEAKYVPLGYHRNLEQIRHAFDKDIDVLFYGSVTPGGRREKILNELVQKSVKVKVLFGVYGKERDEWIGRSKIILNIHHYSAQIFESVRVSFLLNNRCLVISETSNDYPYQKVSLPLVPYEDLVGAVLRLLKSENEAEALGDSLYNEFKTNYTMAEIIKGIIA